MSETNSNPMFSFFMPGEAYLSVEHDDNLSGERLKAALQQHPIVQQFDVLQQAIRQAETSSIVTIDRYPLDDRQPPQEESQGCLGAIIDFIRSLFGQQQATTRAQMTVKKGQARSQPKFVSNLFLSTPTAFQNNPQQFIEEFIQPIYQSIERSGREEVNAIILQEIAPNWLLNGSQALLGTGGPGGRPILPAEAIDVQAASKPWAFKMQSDKATSAPVRGAQAQGVDVAVLDTAPTRAEFSARYTELKGKNELFDKLVAPDGSVNLNNNRFEVQYYAERGAAASALMSKLNSHEEGAGIAGHDYEMRDHGLFASGIAASISPTSKIYLVEVLNQWGVGTAQTVLDGLNSLMSMKRNRSRRLVVNMSLTFDIPFPRYMAHRAKIEWYRPIYDVYKENWGWFEKWVNTHKDFVERSIAPIHETCKILVRDYGAMIVAAAGNDSYGAQERLDARFPAAFDSVLGVGATGKDPMNHAAYSNKGDKPEKVGVITFGGEMAANSVGAGTTLSDFQTMTADANYGILGLYIGKIPPKPGETGDGQFAPDGWARWMGTSFASPVIAGVLARQLEAGKTPQEAEDYIRNAIATDPPASEDVFSVQQGV